MLKKVKIERISSEEVKNIVNELNKKDEQLEQMKDEQKLKDAKMEAKVDKLEEMVLEMLKNVK
jgi:hypothetical protein